jgi:ankyrin repeat protein
MWAAETENLEAVNALIAAKANLDVRDGVTTLHTVLVI